MDRYVSNFTNKLDAKGRVSIPASYRAVLARDGYEGLYVHPALDVRAVDCGGNALLFEIDSVLNEFAPYSEERDFFSTALLGTSEILKIDSEGRIGLTESVKHHAGVTNEITFVGQGYKFQIWEPNAFQAHLEEAKNRARDLYKQRGSRRAGTETPPRPHGARE